MILGTNESDSSMIIHGSIIPVETRTKRRKILGWNDKPLIKLSIMGFNEKNKDEENN